VSVFFNIPFAYSLMCKSAYCLLLSYWF